MAIRAIGAAYAMNILADSASTSRKRNGLLEGECSFESFGEPGAAGQYLDTALQLGAAHPYNSNIWMETKRIVYGATKATAICTYAGVEYEFLDVPTYDLIIGTEEAPIETHPDFLTIAGKPSAPVNGAIFLDPSTGNISTDDAVGVFDRFAPYVGGNINPKAGIEAFLDPVRTYRESLISDTIPTNYAVGTIASNLPGPGGGNVGKRTWLFTGMNYKRRGDPNGQVNKVIYEITNEWRLSGRRGWDKDIYAAG